MRIAIAGGAEAWKVAPQLAAAKVPVFVDPLANLPGDFDQIGATLENAARLRAAGVQVGFTQCGELAQRAQGAPARRQRGRQRPAVGRRPGRR